MIGGLMPAGEHVPSAGCLAVSGFWAMCQQMTLVLENVGIPQYLLQVSSLHRRQCCPLHAPHALPAGLAFFAPGRDGHCR
ncbi:hypothetical protein XOC_4153 [Xanthomonas oryzae pv. oryzicola BLS256]|uniref:Uncharacterized protein n=1 Tax=Xanthomonas oryzae pv. oryzicola (strain BLS256) TaxID=383407 RepID=G7TJL0_XANOB|nr:hypothetical protein XOC_4153 [Xanthomonas oryzae pv. oryzicola BLS256]